MVFDPLDIFPHDPRGISCNDAVIPVKTLRHHAARPNDTFIGDRHVLHDKYSFANPDMISDEYAVGYINVFPRFFIEEQMGGIAAPYRDLTGKHAVVPDHA